MRSLLNPIPMQEPHSQVAPTRRKVRKPAFRFSSRNVLREVQMRSGRRYNGIDKVTCTPDIDNDTEPSHMGPLQSLRGKSLNQGRGRGRGWCAYSPSTVEVLEDGALDDGGEKRTPSQVCLRIMF